MQQSQLKPASQLAQRFGVKALAYGPPGSGKTPLFNTAPRPVMCVVEPGMLSMRSSSVPCWEAYTVEKINEFFDWLFTSHESKNFDTVGIDSISQLAEIILTDELNPRKNKDGRAAYGKMSIAVMKIVNALYYFPQKHVYMIAKQGVEDQAGIAYKKPFFPGQDLNVKIPHLYDEILRIAPVQFPGSPKAVTAIRCHPDFDCLARDRSGMLAEYEPPDLSALFKKAMS